MSTQDGMSSCVQLSLDQLVQDRPKRVSQCGQFRFCCWWSRVLAADSEPASRSCSVVSFIVSCLLWLMADGHLSGYVMIDNTWCKHCRAHLTFIFFKLYVFQPQISVNGCSAVTDYREWGGSENPLFCRIVKTNIWNVTWSCMSPLYGVKSH